jgi:anti-sigma regulatory factor (Ser/Thr protein kinase)/ActR/RegA family two-component response regulator
MLVDIRVTVRANKSVRHVLLIGPDYGVNGPLGEALTRTGCTFECAAGDADALRRIRRKLFDVVVTSPLTSVDEDLALLEGIREARPGVRIVILAPQSTPEDVIAALRARAFACFTPPFNVSEIAELASLASDGTDWSSNIEVLSARRGWVSLRVNCHMLTAERLITFLRGMRSDLAPETHESLMLAFREILINAMEHGAKFDPEKVVEVAAVHTDRAMVFYVRDPGAGFRTDAIAHSALSNPPDDPTAHMDYREAASMRAGGYGLLMVRNVVDEMMFNEVGNEVLLIKRIEGESVRQTEKILSAK